MEESIIENIIEYLIAAFMNCSLFTMEVLLTAIVLILIVGAFVALELIRQKISKMRVKLDRNVTDAPYKTEPGSNVPSVSERKNITGNINK